MVAGVAFAVDVPRGSDEPTFNPGIGGPNTVVVTEGKPVVFQGEEDVEFVDASGNPIQAANLIGVSGSAEGIPLEEPIPEDQTLGQYAINGRAGNIGVTVQRPRITDLSVLNERGFDIEGATVDEDQTLLVSARWNFKQAEDLSLEVLDANGNEVTGDVITSSDDLSDQQISQLSGAYAQLPEKVGSPRQRGTGTGIEYLQGFGQFTQAEADNLTQGNQTLNVDRAYWALDMSDQNAGDYTITVEGWDDLDFGTATQSSVVTLTTERDIILDLESDEATRGQNVGYTIRGSEAGATHLVAIEDNEFRNNNVDERVFRNVGDVIRRGSFDTNNDTEADFAWAEVIIDDDTGLGEGQIDTTYLDDTSVDVNLYQPDRPLAEVADDLGDTEDDLTLDVGEGTLSFESPVGTYIAGQEIDVRGTATPGVDDIAIYVRDQGDWELADMNEDGNFDLSDLISVDSEGEWEERDVTLSEASDILAIPGRYRIGVIEAEDVVSGGEIQETLTTSEFSSATSEQTSIIVQEPGLGGAGGALVSPFVGQAGSSNVDANVQQQQADQDESTYVFQTINGQVAVEDGTVDVLGTAPGLQDVLVVMIDTRGRVVTEQVSVGNDDVFEEDDIELTTQDGRDLNEDRVVGFVYGIGRDNVAGDGVLPGQNGAELSDLENYVQSLGGSGFTQTQVLERFLDETVGEAGSDDLVLQQTFRYADASTTVETVVPQEVFGQPGFERGVEPIEVGQTMTVQGMTNRKPDDNTITIEVIDGPSAAEFQAEATDEWGRTGVWSVNLSAEDVEPGTYTLEVDDGDNTDIVEFEVVPEGEGVQPAEEEETTTEEPANETETNETTTTTPGNETTAAGDNETDVAEETTTAAGNQSQQGAQGASTLEIQSEGDTLNYTISFDGMVEPVDDQTEASDAIQDGTATGQVGDGDASDAYQFDGQITDMSAQGDLNNVTFLLDGEEVPPEELTNATANGASMVGPPVADGAA